MPARELQIGDVRLTRISYIELPIDPTIVGLTADEVRATDWAAPIWADAEGQPLASASTWVIESGDACIVVDPAQAVDDLLRADDTADIHQQAFAALMAEAGVPRERVTHAIATHLDGTGMLAWRNDDGTWVPFFPNARLLFSEPELDAVDRGEHPAGPGQLVALRAAGVVEGVPDGFAVTSEVTLHVTGHHTPGHAIVRIESGGQAAVMVGHLAVVAVHVGTGPCPPQHMEPDAAWEALEVLRDSGALLIGPLWPEPGAGTWDGFKLVPA